MPQRDKTGPLGQGRKDGRGRGWCNLLFSSGRISTRKAGMFGVLIPIFGTIIRDLLNPYGLIRPIFKQLLPQKFSLLKKDQVDADYTVMDEKETE